MGRFGADEVGLKAILDGDREGQSGKEKGRVNPSLQGKGVQAPGLARPGPEGGRIYRLTPLPPTSPVLDDLMD